jgi:hypothetical protein
VSTKSLASGDGYVAFTVSETNTYRMIGLSSGNTDASYTDIDFAIHARADGMLTILEKGLSRGGFGAYVSGDTLEVGVASGSVQYKKNGTVLYTSSQGFGYPLLVDTALYSPGATFTGVVISGDWTTTAPPPPPAGEDVVWTSLVGVSASGNSLTKTASTGWGNAGAASTKSLASGDGHVAFTVGETNAYRMIGLSNGNANANYTEIDFAIHLRGDGAVTILENGALRGIFGTYAAGDTLQVAVVSGSVQYKKNGSLLYTSSQSFSYPLLVDTALYSQGATLTGVVISGDWQ